MGRPMPPSQSSGPRGKGREELGLGTSSLYPEPPEALSSVLDARKPQEMQLLSPCPLHLAVAFPCVSFQIPTPLFFLDRLPGPVTRVHESGQMDWNILLTSFKLEMSPEEELERPKRFSMVVRLLLK